MTPPKFMAHVYTRMTREREAEIRRIPRAPDSLVTELLAALSAERQEREARLLIAAQLVERKTTDETLLSVGEEIRGLVQDEDEPEALAEARL